MLSNPNGLRETFEHCHSERSEESRQLSFQ
jgi:hypothetical protein